MARMAPRGIGVQRRDGPDRRGVAGGRTRRPAPVPGAAPGPVSVDRRLGDDRRRGHLAVDAEPRRLPVLRPMRPAPPRDRHAPAGLRRRPLRGVRRRPVVRRSVRRRAGGLPARERRRRPCGRGRAPTGGGDRRPRDPGCRDRTPRPRSRLVRREDPRERPRVRGPTAGAVPDARARGTGGCRRGRRPERRRAPPMRGARARHGDPRPRGPAGCRRGGVPPATPCPGAPRGRRRPGRRRGDRGRATLVARRRGRASAGGAGCRRDRRALRALRRGRTRAGRRGPAPPARGAGRTDRGLPRQADPAEGRRAVPRGTPRAPSRCRVTRRGVRLRS